MSDRILVMHEGRITAEIAARRRHRGAGHVRGDRPGRPTRPPDAPERPVAEAADPGRRPEPAVAGVAVAPGDRPPARAEPRRSSWSCSASFVAIQAPQFLSTSNLTQVTAHASIIAVAAVGEAIVVITRNVDLSVEAMIGLVAFVVADLLALETIGAPVRDRRRGRAGARAGAWSTAFSSRCCGSRRSSRRSGTLSASTAGSSCLLAGGKQITLTQLPAGYTDMRPGDGRRHPAVRRDRRSIVVIVAAVVLRQTTFGRQVYAVGSNPEAAEILGIRTRADHVRRRSPSAGCWPASPA